MSNERVLGIDYGTDGGTSLVLAERRSNGDIQIIDMISDIGTPLSAKERENLTEFTRHLKQNRTPDAYAHVAAGLSIHQFIESVIKPDLSKLERELIVYGTAGFGMSYGVSRHRGPPQNIPRFKTYQIDSIYDFATVMGMKDTVGARSLNKHHPTRKTQPNRGPRGKQRWNS